MALRCLLALHAGGAPRQLAGGVALDGWQGEGEGVGWGEVREGE